MSSPPLNGCMIALGHFRPSQPVLRPGLCLLLAEGGPEVGFDADGARSVLRERGGSWFYDESYVILRRRTRLNHLACRNKVSRRRDLRPASAPELGGLISRQRRILHALEAEVRTDAHHVEVDAVKICID